MYVKLSTQNIFYWRYSLYSPFCRLLDCEDLGGRTSRPPL